MKEALAWRRWEDGGGGVAVVLEGVLGAEGFVCAGGAGREEVVLWSGAVEERGDDVGSNVMLNGGVGGEGDCWAVVEVGRV